MTTEDECIGRTVKAVIWGKERTGTVTAVALSHRDNRGRFSKKPHVVISVQLDSNQCDIPPAFQYGPATVALHADVDDWEYI